MSSGFWDATADEALLTEKPFKTMSRTQAEGGPSRDKLERDARKDDKKKLEELKKTDMVKAVMKLNDLKDMQQERKRSKLVLPSPQVSEAELEEIVKMGKSMDDLGVAAEGPTGSLLQEYNALTPAATAQLRTPRTPAVKDSLMTEAKNILALNATSSVLAVSVIVCVCVCVV